MPPRYRNRKQGAHEPDYAETGVQMHREIREEMGLVDIPIIFLTVVRDHDIRHEIGQRERQYGHRPVFLTKPVRTNEVVAKVQEALGDPQNEELL